MSRANFNRYAAFKRPVAMSGMKIGLYGGSFDPPHFAHRHVARTAMKRLGLDRVWWLVSPGNPFKSHAPDSMDERVDLIRELAAEPKMVVSTLEAELSSHRTADVISALQSRHRGVRFVWIMGADGFADMHRWHNWRCIIQAVPICVISRPGFTLKAQTSVAARQLARFRLAQIRAKHLLNQCPGWTYLTEPLHPHASSVIRQCDGT